MNSFLIIFIVVAAIYLLVLLMVAKITYEKGKKKDKKIHVCIYNDMSGCYETPCKYCIAKNECQWVCEGDCDSCLGHKLKPFKEEGIK